MKCPICIQKFSNENAVETHQKKCHPFCSKCNKRFLSSRNLAKHLKNVACQKQPGKLKIYNYSLFMKTQINISEQALVKCTMCPKQFANEPEMETHRSECHPICAKCNKKFARKQYLADHLKNDVCQKISSELYPTYIALMKNNYL